VNRVQVIIGMKVKVSRKWKVKSPRVVVIQ